MNYAIQNYIKTCLKKPYRNFNLGCNIQNTKQLKFKNNLTD